MLFLQKTPQGVIFKIFVLPRSSRNMIAGYYGDAIKIKLTAPPVDGSANKLCLKYLSKCLNIPKSSLEIVSGHSSRNKTILIRFNDANDSEKQYNRIKHQIDSLLEG